MRTWLKSAQTARHGYDGICAHSLFILYRSNKQMFVMFMPNSEQLTTAHYFMIEKCVSVQKSPTENVML
jgi:hypothetical protein